MNYREKRRVEKEKKIKFISENYKVMSAIDISNHLDCNESTIYKYAKELNLTKECIPWSTEEDLFLIDYWNEYDKPKFLKEFKRNGYKRTLKSIEGRVKKLKIKSDITNGGIYFSPKDLVELLGFSIYKINSLLYRGNLKYEIIRRKRRVDIESLRNFLVNNQNLWHCSNADIYILKGLFCKVKFKYKSSLIKEIQVEEWLLQKIKRDSINEFKEKKDWTTKEVELLHKLIEQNLSYTEISKILDRRYSSTHKKIKEIS